MSALPEELGARLAALALLLRTGRSAEACADLPELMDAIAGAMGEQAPACQQMFAAELAIALQGWERHDWLGLADTLEYELAAALLG